MARMKASRLAVAVGLLCGTMPALADPISLLATLAPIIGGSAAAFIISNAGVIALAGFGLARGVGARRKQRAAAASARAQYNASLQDRNITLPNTEAPWQVVYGNPAPIGGAIVAILSSGDRDQYKHLVVVFASHECQAIDEIYLDGEAIGTLDGNGDCTAGIFYETRTDTATEVLVVNASGEVTTSSAVVQLLTVIPQFGESEGYSGTASGTTVTISPATEGETVYVTYTYAIGMPRVNVQKHLSPGGVDTADAYLISRCPDQWTSTDKLSGFTYAVVTLDQELARFQGGPPAITGKLRGKKVYDWRTGLTAYSSCAPLCLADFLMSEAGFLVDLAQIDADAIIAAANAADASGFACDGAFSTDQPRETTKQQLEDSFGGSCHDSGGVWRILPGAWTAPVMDLTDADLAAPIQISQASHASKDRFNTARGSYIDGASLGVATDITPWVNSAHVATDGQARPVDMSFPFTKDHQRCQDLARMRVERSRGGMVITYPGHMRLFPLQPGDRVRVVNAEFGFASKTFRCTGWTFHPRSPATPTLEEDVAAYYDAATVITTDAAPNSNLPDPYTTVNLQGLVASSGTDQLVMQADGTVIPGTLLAWTAAASNYVLRGGQVQVQHRLASATDGVWQALALTGDATSVHILGMQEARQHLLRARFVNQLGIPGAWTTIVHTVIGKTEPPSDVISFAVDQDGVATWTAVDDVDVRTGGGYRLRWQPGTNRSWGDATPLHDGLLTHSSYRINIRPSGIATFMAKAVDSLGNESLDVAASVINLGNPVVQNVVTTTDYQALGYPGTITNATVSGGDLVADADASPLAWDANENTAGWTLDTNAAWTAVTYKPVTYAPEGYSVAAVDDGCQLTLAHDIIGTAYLIAYRRDGDALGWTTDLEPGWTADADPAWDTEDFRPFPGTIVAREGRYEFQVTTQSLDVQSVIGELAVQLDVPDLVETVGQVTVLAAGTVVPITKSFRAVTAIGLTLVADGGTAETARVESLSTRTVTTRNAANAAVDGTVLATVQGY